jgi:hypothetical protein
MNGDFVRGRAFNLALLGTALAQQGDIEQAAAIGLKAADIAMKIHSQRSVRYVIDLERRLADTAAPVVKELTQQTRALVQAHAVHQ